VEGWRGGGVKGWKDDKRNLILHKAVLPASAVLVL